jgi:type II secretory ATPase GspE/PulE/Tfp pilus assembly ATPase PilB-like protein
MTPLSNSLKKALLLKLLSQHQPESSELPQLLEMISQRVAEALSAEAVSIYLLEGPEIHFKHVYYNPTLWANNPDQKAVFDRRKAQLMEVKLAAGQGVVGRSIQQNTPLFYDARTDMQGVMLDLSEKTGFKVQSMLTVPLAGVKPIGAIQVLNKQVSGSQSSFFSQDDLAILREVAEYTGPLLQRMIDSTFNLSDNERAKFIARFTGCPLILTEDKLAIDERISKTLDPKVLKEYNIFPYKQLSTGVVGVLMTNPLDYPLREAFTAATRLTIGETIVIPEALLSKVFAHYQSGSSADAEGGSKPESLNDLVTIIGHDYLSENQSASSIEEAIKSEEAAPIIQLANRIIEDAFLAGASDIHLEPQETDLLVRYRIDGVCQEKLHLPRAVTSALTTRLKIMADLDISERRLPQDGRIVFKKYTKKSMDFDLRVATGPMNFGEKVCLRILDKTKSALPITSLGFSEENLTKYRDTIRQPYGMILHCGPTGSGKSMTLFSALREIARPDINIQTAEDPIEYTIPGINQMQVNRGIGLTFASALRAYLRMDPDVILIGEIRDRETAEIAVEAALTGHLLLSTLHTNDAPSTVARLLDMGIEPFMIAASILVVCAQRLVRKVCPQCRVVHQPADYESEILMRALQWKGDIFKSSDHGCSVCSGRGLRGRTGIHELMVNNDELARAISKRMDTSSIKEIAVRHGMKTLHQDSMLKVKEGMTTLEEALATVPPDAVVRSHD